MILIINTANNVYAEIAIVNKDKLIKSKRFKAQYKQAEKLLIEIQKLFKNQKLSINKITGIIVVRGPGSFTSLRIGMVVANTLAWSIKIPVVGIKLNEYDDLKNLAEISQLLMSKAKKNYLVEPWYCKEPNITTKK